MIIKLFPIEGFPLSIQKKKKEKRHDGASQKVHLKVAFLKSLYSHREEGKRKREAHKRCGRKKRNGRWAAACPRKNALSADDRNGEKKKRRVREKSPKEIDHYPRKAVWPISQKKGER